MPVANGSRVPACPALAASNTRRTVATACAELTPDGLSMTTQPCTGWPRLRRAIPVGLPVAVGTVFPGLAPGFGALPGFGAFAVAPPRRAAQPLGRAACRERGGQ